MLSLLIATGEPALTKLIAGTASGFSMQSIDAKTWYARLVKVIGFGFVFFASFSLGLIVRDSVNWTAITLVAMGFIVNYMRRFGLENSVVPMRVWVLCFLATILPFAHADEAWEHVQGLMIGLSVTVCIMFVFPDNYSRLFRTNSMRFFKTLAQGLREIRQYVLIPDLHAKFDDLPFVHTKMTLMQLIDCNQTIEQSPIFAGEEKQISDILAHQYALHSAYSLMVDAYHRLWLCKYQISRSSTLILSQMNRLSANLLSEMIMRKDFTVYSESGRVSLPNLAKRLGRISPSDPILVMALLNLKLSFDLLDKHIEKLLQNSDET